MTVVYNPNNVDSDNFNIKDNSTERCDLVCNHLKAREVQWWQARRRMVTLKERQVFWFGDNSTMMWLLWQLVAYVVIAILLMLSARLLGISWSYWGYMLVFGLQTIFFFGMFAFKGHLANRIQNRIDKADITCEQAFNEMVVLAKDSIFADIHAQSPISLMAIYERYDAQLHLASLRCLLQGEVESGRLIIKQKRVDADILPIDLADKDLAKHATEILYRSTL